MSLFRRLLNPAQVVDLSERDPVAVLEWCRLLGKVTCTVLVAGGDGTIAWLLNAIHKLGLEVICVLLIIFFYVKKETNIPCNIVSCRDLDVVLFFFFFFF